MSAETKWTPGPWHTDERSDLPYFVPVHAGKRVVAQADRGLSDREGLSGLEESYANANLIAAAPDLYAALYHVRNILSDYPVAQRKGYIPEAWKIADAALSRARGAA